MSRVVVVDYDPAWPRTFQLLKDRAWAVVEDFAVAVEHIGSTAVPGLAAKPVIDMDVVVRSSEQVQLAIERLATIGYKYRGNLGIYGREAFSEPADAPAHHLYLCTEDSPALKNHLALRDYLRSHPEAVRTYAVLKRGLALQFPEDIDSYIEGKTDFILAVLKVFGLSPDRLEIIRNENRKSC